MDAQRIKANFVGGKFDGQQLEVSLVDGNPTDRVEYVDRSDPPQLGLYKIADRYTGQTPTYVFQGLSGLNAAPLPKVGN